MKLFDAEQELLDKLGFIENKNVEGHYVCDGDGDGRTVDTLIFKGKKFHLEHSFVLQESNGITYRDNDKTVPMKGESLTGFLTNYYS